MSAADLPVWRRQRSVVVVIGLTQMLAWGSTYYLPAVMADPIAAHLHVPSSWFYGIFSAALLLAGLLGPLAGRTLDRRGGRRVLTAASLVFAVGLAAMAAAQGVVGLTLAWMIVGVGMGFGLYEGAFATVAALYGLKARGAMTGITLFGGFASTVCWPASVVATDAFGWRGACLLWALLHAGAMGLHWVVIPDAPHPGDGEAPTEAETVAWSPTMIVLAGVFAAILFVAAAMAAHLPRLLVSLGATPAVAIAAAALIGPAQVGARLVEFGLLRSIAPLNAARVAAALHPIGALLLVVIGAPVAAVFSLLHGAGNGLLTIARGTLPLALYGATGYGLRAGMLSAPGRILQSLAPVLFGLVLEGGGPIAALLFSGLLTAAACVGLMVVRAPFPLTDPDTDED